MTKAVTRTWYRVALASPRGGRLVAASGEHMGQAIAEAEGQLPGSWAIAVDHATADQIPLGESVGRGHVVQLGPAPAIQTYRWPIGVVPSLDGAATFAPARTGWIEHADELHVIEAQTDATQLTDVFLGLIERLPAADNLEVRVLDHFDDAGVTDVWLTSRINAKKALRMLDDYDDDLIHNGHLELNVYLRKHKATLRLTQHKTVVWLADDRALQADVVRWLRELHVAKLDGELVTVASGPHFHYRPGKSRDRKKLGEELYRQRLRKVDTVTPSG